MYVLFLVLLASTGFSSAKEFVDKLGFRKNGLREHENDITAREGTLKTEPFILYYKPLPTPQTICQHRYIIACHTTDFECFKRQYKALRDNALLGNDKLGIPLYKHFVFEYSKSTCVKLSGLEESELTAIGMKHHPNKFSMTLELPLRIQQVKNTITKQCAKPDRDFNTLKMVKGALMRFSGNATVEISYPFKLRKKKSEIYLKLEDEDLDVILDIPDLSHFDMTSEVESKLFEWSEWAYDVVQHVDAAQKFALPYTSQMRTLMDHIPLRRFLLLYPEEDFIDAHFSFKKEP